MSEWQPKETAPRGDPGPEILVWMGSGMSIAQHAWNDDNGAPVFFNGDVVVYFTHWMELPAPPNEPTAE
jgi:hypothetical protein